MTDQKLCVKCGVEPQIGLVVAHSHEGMHEDDQYNYVEDMCETCRYNDYVEDMNQWYGWCVLLESMTGVDRGTCDIIGMELSTEEYT